VSNVWFCSDLHFGHKGIEKFRGQTEFENRQRIKNDWQSVVTKRDIVYVLGDAAFTMETVSDFQELPGQKFLVRGNHDTLNTSVYLKYFDEVYGLLKYKEFWLSHAPIHPNELRGRINLHGHVHNSTVDDKNYFNCCPENLWPILNRSLISLDELRKGYANRNI
jgi:calcineurin-like phosphoesterase family protein